MKRKTQFGPYDESLVDGQDYGRHTGWSSHGDGEPRWLGPPHLDPDLARRRAMLAGREPSPVVECAEPLMEKVYRCKCGKALDPAERGMLCGGCRG